MDSSPSTSSDNHGRKVGDRNADISLSEFMQRMENSESFRDGFHAGLKVAAVFEDSTPGEIDAPISTDTPTQSGETSEETDTEKRECEYCGTEFDPKGIGPHQARCPENPDRITSTENLPTVDDSDTLTEKIPDAGVDLEERYPLETDTLHDFNPKRRRYEIVLMMANREGKANMTVSEILETIWGLGSAEYGSPAYTKVYETLRDNPDTFQKTGGRPKRFYLAPGHDRKVFPEVLQ